MGTIRLLTTLGEKYDKNVSDGSEQQWVNEFLTGAIPQEHDWLKVGDKQWIRRDTIAAIEIL
jgi:hypothetical protein